MSITKLYHRRLKGQEMDQAAWRWHSWVACEIESL